MELYSKRIPEFWKNRYNDSLEFIKDPINVGAKRLEKSFPLLGMDPLTASPEEMIDASIGTVGFGGILGRQPNRKKIVDASNRYLRKFTDQEVWDKTNTVKIGDNYLTDVTDDTYLKLKPSFKNLPGYEPRPISSSIDKRWEIPKGLEDTRIRKFEKFSNFPSTRAYFDISENEIGIRSDMIGTGLRESRILAHELTHSLGAKQGLPYGTNLNRVSNLKTNASLRKAINSHFSSGLERQIKKQGMTNEIINVIKREFPTLRVIDIIDIFSTNPKTLNKIDSLSNLSDYQVYKHELGEATARMSEQRLYNPIRKNNPWKTLIDANKEDLWYE